MHVANGSILREGSFDDFEVQKGKILSQRRAGI